MDVLLLLICPEWRPTQVNKHFFLNFIAVSSQRRKSRKAHFGAPSSIRRKMMSCHLSKDLRTKYNCRSVPVRKGDTVLINSGCSKLGGKGQEGKVLTVYRRRWCIHVEKVTRDKKSGT